MNADPPSPMAPVFLVGCPRSGTTLLQRLLDAHSCFAIAPETAYLRRFWKERARFGDLARDESFRSLLDEIVALPEVAEMDLQAPALRAALERSPRTHRDLFATLLETFRVARGKPRVGEKTPNHLRWMRQLEEWFPGARFVHIVRDPRAVVASWKSVPWSNGSVAADAEVWRKYQAAARLEAPSDPARIHVLRYERLIAEPAAETAAICAFLEVAFEPAMLVTTGTARGVNAEREPWKRAALEAFDPASIDRWRGELTRAEIATIEAVVEPEMRRLGYPLESSWLGRAWQRRSAPPRKAAER